MREVLALTNLILLEVMGAIKTLRNRFSRKAETIPPKSILKQDREESLGSDNIDRDEEGMPMG